MNARQYLVPLTVLVLISLLMGACSPAAPQAATEAPVLEYEAPAAEAAAPVYEEAPANYPSPSPTMSAPNGEPYDTTFFENYGVNPTIDTEDDNLSTFALDVDTGSYTVARRFLSDGNLPDKDSVRVEEFVNYFRQGYRLPDEEERFNIAIDGGEAPFTESERYQIMRVGIQGYAVSDENRKDASLTFVIDVSGSMAREDRLGLVKDALELLVYELDEDDTVGIVVYGSRAHVVLEPTSADRKSKIMRAINGLSSEGSTNAEAGIRLGYRQALEAFIPGGINRVILCSDGVANVGETSAGGIWDEVKYHASEGVTLTTVGFGMGNYNDVLMEQLADQGDGFYAYVDEIDEAERVFVTNLTSTLQVIAMDARVQVDFNPEVVSRYRLIGFENRDMADEDFRNDEVDAGEIGAGHSVTALYEVKLFPEADGEIASVHLRWIDPETRAPSEISRGFYTYDLHRDFEEADPYFQRSVLVAEFAEILRESFYAEKSSMMDVLYEVKRVAGLLEDDPDMGEFASLVKKAFILME
jgi:Ca-activated chloride channel family protein